MKFLHQENKEIHKSRHFVDTLKVGYCLTTHLASGLVGTINLLKRVQNVFFFFGFSFFVY